VKSRALRGEANSNADAGRMRVSWIISLVEASDPSAVRLSLAEADAYLASVGDPTETAARRADLVSELHERLPRTALANAVIEAIASEAGGG
jgi:hypothetical protein